MYNKLISEDYDKKEKQQLKNMKELENKINKLIEDFIKKNNNEYSKSELIDIIKKKIT